MLLIDTWGAAAFGDVFLLQPGQARDDIGVFVLHVGLLANVGSEVVKLHGRQALRLLGAGTGRAPPAGVGTQFQFPVALPMENEPLME